MNKVSVQQVCLWDGDGEGCRHTTVYGKSYCETHYNRMYEPYLPEMADYIVTKELNETLARYKAK
jgi:hypothetical protein